MKAILATVIVIALLCMTIIAKTTGTIVGSFQTVPIAGTTVLVFVGTAACYVDGIAVDPTTSWSASGNIRSSSDEFTTWWYWSGTYRVSCTSGYQKKDEKNNIVNQWFSTWYGSETF